ncbi:MAG: hypothetical protein ISR69_14365 [Gammaproteobacteria bacterium]|nr:hypothetical protein [Gammaproteobacteria bacterium]
MNTGIDIVLSRNRLSRQPFSIPNVAEDAEMQNSNLSAFTVTRAIPITHQLAACGLRCGSLRESIQLFPALKLREIALITSENRTR